MTDDTWRNTSEYLPAPGCEVVFIAEYVEERSYVLGWHTGTHWIDKTDIDNYGDYIPVAYRVQYWMPLRTMPPIGQRPRRQRMDDDTWWIPYGAHNMRTTYFRRCAWRRNIRIAMSMPLKPRRRMRWTMRSQ